MVREVDADVAEGCSAAKSEQTVVLSRSNQTDRIKLESLQLHNKANTLWSDMLTAILSKSQPKRLDRAGKTASLPCK